MSSLSIIIPTFNRRDLLLKALAGYDRQTAHGDILEILVIDDGSTDATPAAVAKYAETSRLAVRCLVNPKKGQASARNQGIRAACGSLILLADDDIVPAPNLVSEHVGWLRQHSADNFAVLGHVNWAPEIHPTPFMEWLGTDGVLFGFRRLSPGEEVGPHYFYSCNISFKRDFLIREGMFDENFRAYGYEDIELGYRLISKGLRVLYNPAAIGFHYKRLSYADACRRQESLCAAMVQFEQTEAGRALRGHALQLKPPTLKRKLTLAMAKIITPLLVPLIPLLDTHIGLPRVVYSLVYFFHVAPRAQARFVRSRGSNEVAKAI
jgi:glycosyltransferase involved in cell wall biosynthesis